MQENIFLIFTMIFGGFTAGFFSQDVFKYLEFRRRARFLHKLTQERRTENAPAARPSSSDFSLAEEDNAQENAS